MTGVVERLALKGRLPRTWPAFFERHGNFTPVQVAAIPPILDGRDVIVSAPTAGGKTEAVMAPLVERLCRHGDPAPAILYIVPTRALVNDLAARLRQPLRLLRLALAVKTRDATTLKPARPPAVLLTTPESADALLATNARLFATVRAVVLDELHLLDGTPRGDGLRVILNRIRQIRAYAHAVGDASDAGLQCVALSATLPRAAAVAARYCRAATVVQVGGARPLEVEWVGLPPREAAGLIAYLEGFAARGWRKALVFCNSRAEVEAYAAAVRERSPFGGAVYVHYSNIEARRRRETERQFAGAAAAILFATSTLELGIDVGDIDVVVLVGPPGGVASFVQRIGRGNRRRGVTRVACCYRSELERIVFEVLVAPAPAPVPAPAPGDLMAAAPAPFRPAVAVQQIFSLLKGSPSGAVRLTELAPLFAGMLAPDELEEVLDHLRQVGYLAIGRPGEWRAGERLNDLVDRQASAHYPLSIYSNIAGSAQRQIEIRDQYSGETVARVDPQWMDRPLLTLEGRPLNVEWEDGEAMWVVPYVGHDMAERLAYRSERQLLSYDLARLLPAHLGLQPGTAPLVAVPDGWLLFHWLGDVYGRALFDLLRYRLAATETAQPGLCIHLPDEPHALPVWTEAQVRQYLDDTYRTLESLLPLGPFQNLLPVSLRRQSVVDQFDVPRFLEAVAALRPALAPEALAADLAGLL